MMYDFFSLDDDQCKKNTLLIISSSLEPRENTCEYISEYSYNRYKQWSL